MIRTQSYSIFHQEFLHDKILDDLLVARLEDVSVGLCDFLHGRECSQQVRIIIVHGGQKGLVERKRCGCIREYHLWLLME